MVVTIGELVFPELTKLPQNWGISVPFYLPEEYKSADFNRKQGIITAYLTVYNNADGTPFIDPYDDIVLPGSFTKTISELDAGRKSRNNPWLCPNLWQHERKEVIGGVRSLGEDSKGVIYETQFAMGLQRAQEAFELAEQKMLGSSYGYDPIRYEPKQGKRHLQEIRLREVSQVTFPANNIAPILETKQKWYVPALPVMSPTPTGGEPGTVTKKDSPDFLEAWGARAEDAVMGVLYSMNSAMMRALTATVDDDDLDGSTTSDQSARISAINTILSQFGDAVRTWLPTYQQADDLSDQYGSDDLNTLNSCYCSMDMAKVAFKELLENFSVKSGKVLSAATHKKLSSKVTEMHGHLNDMQTMLDTANPSPTSKTTVSASQEEDAVDITQGLVNIWDTQKQTPSNTPPVVPSQQANAPISFPSFPQEEVYITSLLEDIRKTMGVKTIAPNNSGVPAVHANGTSNS